MICLTKAGMIEISGGEEARMPRKNSRNTKGRIIAAAWKLFYEQGFEETTIEDIVYESETSKGSFYHYFKGKDELMGTLANVFDEKYEQLMVEMDPGLDAMEKLIYVNHELFSMIDGGVSMDLLSRLLSTQLLARGEKHLLDRSRVYFRLLKKIVRQGAERGEFRPGLAQEAVIFILPTFSFSHFMNLTCATLSLICSLRMFSISTGFLIAFIRIAGFLFSIVFTFSGILLNNA